MGNKVSINELEYDVVPENIITEWSSIKLGVYKGKFVLIIANKDLFYVKHLFYKNDKELYIKACESVFDKLTIKMDKNSGEEIDYRLKVKEDYIRIEVIYNYSNKDRINTFSEYYGIKDFNKELLNKIEFISDKKFINYRPIY
jgi:hypothetical protein